MACISRSFVMILKMLKQVRNFLVKRLPKNVAVNARLVANFRGRVKRFLKTGSLKKPDRNVGSDFSSSEDGPDMQTYVRDMLAETLREKGYAFPKLLRTFQQENAGFQYRILVDKESSSIRNVFWMTRQIRRTFDFGDVCYSVHKLFRLSSISVHCD